MPPACVGHCSLSVFPRQVIDRVHNLDTMPRMLLPFSDIEIRDSQFDGALVLPMTQNMNVRVVNSSIERELMLFGHTANRSRIQIQDTNITLALTLSGFGTCSEGIVVECCRLMSGVDIEAFSTRQVNVSIVGCYIGIGGLVNIYGGTFREKSYLRLLGNTMHEESGIQENIWGVKLFSGSVFIIAHNGITCMGGGCEAFDSITTNGEGSRVVVYRNSIVVGYPTFFYDMTATKVIVSHNVISQGGGGPMPDGFQSYCNIVNGKYEGAACSECNVDLHCNATLVTYMPPACVGHCSLPMFPRQFVEGVRSLDTTPRMLLPFSDIEIRDSRFEGALVLPMTQNMNVRVVNSSIEGALEFLGHAINGTQVNIEHSYVGHSVKMNKFEASGVGTDIVFYHNYLRGMVYCATFRDGCRIRFGNNSIYDDDVLTGAGGQNFDGASILSGAIFSLEQNFIECRGSSFCEFFSAVLVSGPGSLLLLYNNTNACGGAFLHTMRRQDSGDIVVSHNSVKAGSWLYKSVNQYDAHCNTFNGAPIGPCDVCLPKLYCNSSLATHMPSSCLDKCTPSLPLLSSSSSSVLYAKAALHNVPWEGWGLLPATSPWLSQTSLCKYSGSNGASRLQHTHTKSITATNETNLTSSRTGSASESYGSSTFSHSSTATNPTATLPHSLSLSLSLPVVSPSISTPIGDPPEEGRKSGTASERVMGTIVTPEGAKSIQGIGGGAGYASALALAPTSLSYTGRQSRILSNINCAFDEGISEPSWIEGIVASFGDGELAYYAGTALYTTVVLNVVSIFLLVVPYLFHVAHLEEHGVVKGTTKALSAVYGMAVQIYVGTIPGMCVTLIGHASSADQRGIGYCMLAAILIPVAVATFKLTRGFDAEMCSMKGAQEETAEGTKAFQPKSLRRFFRNKKGHPLFCEAFGVCFDGCRDTSRFVLRAYFLEELLVSFVISCLSGIRPSSGGNGCYGISVSVLLVCLLHVFYLLVLRPYATLLDTVFATGFAILQLIIAVLCVLASSMDDLLEPLGVLVMIQNFAMFIQLIAACAYLYYVHQRKKTLLTLEPNASQGGGALDASFLPPASTAKGSDTMDVEEGEAGAVEMEVRPKHPNAAAQAPAQSAGSNSGHVGNTTSSDGTATHAMRMKNPLENAMPPRQPY